MALGELGELGGGMMDLEAKLGKPSVGPGTIDWPAKISEGSLD